jgi:hypothetical protein
MKNKSTILKFLIIIFIIIILTIVFFGALIITSFVSIGKTSDKDVNFQGEEISFICPKDWTLRKPNTPQVFCENKDFGKIEIIDTCTKNDNSQIEYYTTIYNTEKSNKINEIINSIKCLK